MAERKHQAQRQKWRERMFLAMNRASQWGITLGTQRPGFQSPVSGHSAPQILSSLVCRINIPPCPFLRAIWKIQEEKRFKNTCQGNIKEWSCVKGTAYFGAISSKTNISQLHLSHKTWHQMLLLLEIIPFLLVSRKESDGFSIAMITFRILVLAGTSEII